jgi:hypothetical protein
MSRKAQVYVGVELHAFLTDVIEEIARREGTVVTYQEAILRSLDDERRAEFEDEYRLTTKEKYSR